MSLLVETTLKVSSIIVLALAAGALLRHRSAALRHWMLTAAIVCAAAVPVLQPLVPSWDVPLKAPATDDRPAGGSSASPGAPASATDPAAAVSIAAVGVGTVDTGWWIGVVWLAGAGISLLGLAAGFARLAWLARCARPLDRGESQRLLDEIARANGLRRRVTLLQSDHPGLLVTWGIRRPKVILPAAAREWPGDRMRVVLLHELAHIRRGDWLTQLAAEGLRSVYWFNPLVWIASRRLRQESEHACDDAVLNGGIEGPDYATHLLALARAVRRERRSLLTGLPAPAMARPSSLERRFSAMLDGRINRTPITRPTRIATTLAVAVVTLLVAGLGIAQTFSTFSGAVFDPTNRLLPGVTLVLTNKQTQAKYEIKTDREGRFEFVGLPSGEYTWATSLPGFANLAGSVTVAGRNIQQDLTLQVGSLEETITVVGGRPSTADRTSDRVSAGNVAEIRRKANESLCTESAPNASPGAIGGNIRPPRKLLDVRPRYPEHLSTAGLGGVVVLDAVIDRNGDVSEVSVVRSPSPDLELSAIEAVRQWQFTSTVLNCEPIDVKMKVTVNFKTQ
jgi:TonB family protein